MQAQPTPPSDERTRELGGKYTTGDECYPAKVTVGDFLRVIERPGFEAERTVFFMPTAEGPPASDSTRRSCARFCATRVGKMCRCSLRVAAMVTSTWEHRQSVFADGLARSRCADTIHRAMLKTRPYERTPGDADRAFQESLADLVKTIENSAPTPGASSLRWWTRWRVPAGASSASRPLRPEIPLIGVVGEIFCRLNTFSNEDLIRKLESYGAEACLSHISEWVEYTNNEKNSSST